MCKIILNSPMTELSPQQLELQCVRSSDTSLSSISIRLASCCKAVVVGQPQACLGILMRWVKVTWLSESTVSSVYSVGILSLPPIPLAPGPAIASRSTEHSDSKGTLMLYTWLKIMGWVWLLGRLPSSGACRLNLVVLTSLLVGLGTAWTPKNRRARLTIEPCIAIAHPHITVEALARDHQLFKYCRPPISTVDKKRQSVVYQREGW